MSSSRSSFASVVVTEPVTSTRTKSALICRFREQWRCQQRTLSAENLSSTSFKASTSQRLLRYMAARHPTSVLKGVHLPKALGRKDRRQGRAPSAGWRLARRLAAKTRRNRPHQTNFSVPEQRTFSRVACSAWSSTSSAICVVVASACVMHGGVGGLPPPVASRPTPYVVTALSSM